MGIEGRILSHDNLERLINEREKVQKAMRLRDFLAASNPKILEYLDKRIEQLAINKTYTLSEDTEDYLLRLEKIAKEGFRKTEPEKDNLLITDLLQYIAPELVEQILTAEQPEDVSITLDELIEIIDDTFGPPTAPITLSATEEHPTVPDIFTAETKEYPTTTANPGQSTAANVNQEKY